LAVQNIIARPIASGEKQFTKLYWLWLIPLLLLATGLAARMLGADAIWYDEYRSLFYAGGVPQYGPISLPEVWKRVAEYGGSAQAPGYFMLLNLWGNYLVGWSEFAIRGLSLLFGLLAIAWTYRLGRDAISAKAGLYGAAVLSVSAFLIHYMHELRVYTLFACMTAFVTWVYWRIITAKREPSLVIQAALILGIFVSLYAHYLTGLTFAVIGLYHLLFVRKNARWWRVVILMAVGGALFLPWVSVLINGLDSKARPGLYTGTLQVIQNVAASLANDNLPLLIVALVIALLAKGRGARLLQFLAVGVFIAGLLSNRWLKVGDTRYYIALWPLVALVIGAGLAQVQQRRLGLLLVGGWMTMGLVTTLTNPQFIGRYAGVGLTSSIFPWHSAAGEISQYTQDGDLLAFTMPDPVAGYQQWEIADHYLFDLELRQEVEHTIVARDEGIEKSLERAQDTPLRLWSVSMLDTPTLLPDFENALAPNFQKCDCQLSTDMLQIDLFARTPICCPPVDETFAIARFGEGVRLTGMQLIPETVKDRLDILLGWAIGDDVPPYTYSVALHVIDADGNLAAQGDYGLPEQPFACVPTTIDLSAVPAGDYQLLAIVYAWESGARLPGVMVESGEQGEAVKLGEFEVVRR
jgi:hypothetical protein